MSSNMATPATALVEAKALANGRRQEAHRAASLVYSAARNDRFNRWRQANAAAHARFDRLKSNPSHPEHDDARDTLDALQVQPSDKDLRDDLDTALRTADAQYHAEVRAAAANLGLSSEG